MSIRFELNGKPIETQVPARTTLADCIRHDLGQTGTHVGCEHGVCGACTVLVDDQLARSCLMLAIQTDGAHITTVEGLTPKGPYAGYNDVLTTKAANDGDAAVLTTKAVDAGDNPVLTTKEPDGGLHPVQQAFWDAHGLQCGFCTSGMLITTVDLLRHNRRPTDVEIRAALSGNLCRCTGYIPIVEAVYEARAAYRARGRVKA